MEGRPESTVSAGSTGSVAKMGGKGKESEVEEQVLKEFEEGSRGSGSGSGSGSGDANINAKTSVQEHARERSQSDVGGVGRGGGGYTGYANGGMGGDNGYGMGMGVGVGMSIGNGNGNGNGMSNSNFRTREPELEEDAVVLEGPLVALKGALLAGRFSDLTIVHGVCVWNAHKVVVCSQSEILESMIDSIGVGNLFGNQSRPSILNLSSFPLDSTIALIEYLYTSAYSLPPPTPHPLSPIPSHSLPLPSPTTSPPPATSPYLNAPLYSLPFHESLFHLSTHLQIPALTTLTTASFRHVLNTQISDLDVYFQSIPRIYSLTTKENPGLRNVLVDAALEEFGGLMGDEGLKRMFWRVMGENCGFWEDVLGALVLGGREGRMGMGMGGEVEIREVIREVRVPLEVEKIVEVEKIIEVEKIVERDMDRQGASSSTDDEWFLCGECGPVEGDQYSASCFCRGCGAEKIFWFR